jgi:hypothetical protein
MGRIKTKDLPKDMELSENDKRIFSEVKCVSRCSRMQK